MSCTSYEKDDDNTNTGITDSDHTFIESDRDSVNDNEAKNNTGNSIIEQGQLDDITSNSETFFSTCPDERDDTRDSIRSDTEIGTLDEDNWDSIQNSSGEIFIYGETKTVPSGKNLVLWDIVNF